VRDREAIVSLVAEVRPEVVFHLAAQSLVRTSYDEPAETFDTNVLGTVNVLEAIRRAKIDCSVVIVTTDKCYENREWMYGYRETDRLGGRDPYSASKAAAEIATIAYARSFFDGSGVALSSVRAGNVVGGGDFARDRILPDAMRAFSAGEPLVLRNPAAVRPWQYVLEPLAGYLTLAARQRDSVALRGAYNFGPEPGNERSVGEVADMAARAWGNGRVLVRPVQGQPHEANMLRLDSTKARLALGWKALFGLDETIERTVTWYRAMLGGAEAVVEMRSEIEAFTERSRSIGLRWTEA
jgi:CDP-glucose 4,6-dehydratase